MQRIKYHLPGLFEFLELYKVFLPLTKEHQEYFFDDVKIESIYGSPSDCLWGGGRVGFGEDDINETLKLLKEYSISPRLTFSNSLINQEDLNDYKCNHLCKLLSDKNGGVIVASELLKDYLKKNYPNLYLISSTTKVITDFDKFIEELNNDDYGYVVPDFRLNKQFNKLLPLTRKQKDKVEFLCNECCHVGCKDREACYQSVSKKSKGIDDGFICKAPGHEDGYRFSKAMENPMFIGINEIRNNYLPFGFNNFKIEGRGLGTAVVFEMLLHYMVKPEYHLRVREIVYLDSELDLF